MIDSLKISSKEVQKIFDIEENHFCDLKSIEVLQVNYPRLWLHFLMQKVVNFLLELRMILVNGKVLVVLNQPTLIYRFLIAYSL